MRREVTEDVLTLGDRKDLMLEPAMLLVVVAGVATVALYAAHKDTGKVREAITHASRKAHLHQMLGLIIIVAHASDIGKVITHMTLVHAVAALLLLAVWLATKTADAEELA